MACTISNVRAFAAAGDYDPSTNNFNNVSVSFDVTTGSCASGVFRVTVSDAAGVSNFAQASSSGTGPVTVRIKFGGECGQQVDVVIECLRDPQCRYPVQPGTSAQLTVDCCPAEADASLTVTRQGSSTPISQAQLDHECVPSGYLYTFTAAPSGTGYTYDWKITAGRQPGDPANVNGTATNTFQITLADGEQRTILVNIYPPGNCPEISLTQTLRDCGEPAHCDEPFVWNPETLDCDCPEGTYFDPFTGQCKEGKEPPPKENGSSDCGGLLWAAVICLLISALLAIFSGCFGAYEGYALIAAAIFAALYLILLGAYYLLVKLGICKKKRCHVEEVHVTVLTPAALILGLMRTLCILWPFLPWCGCWNDYAAAGFLAIYGFWVAKYRACRR